MDRYDAAYKITLALEKAMEDETIDYYIDNDGIGAYEYWGATGYDAGTDYLIIEQDNVVTVKLTGISSRLLKLAALDIIEDKEPVIGFIPHKYNDTFKVTGKISDITVKHHELTITVEWDEEQDTP